MYIMKRRRLGNRRWLRLLLGGVIFLGAVFFALPYLRDWIPAKPGSPSATAAAKVTALATSVQQAARHKIAKVVNAPKASVKSPASHQPRSEEPRIRKARAPILSNGQFWVQVGAFRDSKRAARLAARLVAKDYPAVIRSGNSAVVPHLVWVGNYPNRERAGDVRAALERDGYRAFVLRNRWAPNNHGDGRKLSQSP